MALPGGHYNPLPNEEVPAVWEFLKKHSLGKAEQQQAAQHDMQLRIGVGKAMQEKDYTAPASCWANCSD